MSVAARFSERDAPSRRPRPSLAASTSASLWRSTRSGRPLSPCGASTPRCPRGRPAVGAPTAVSVWRMPRRSQNASKISSNLSQSECVAQKRARNAGLSAEARVAVGVAKRANASRVSANPTLKPLSRSVRAKPASFWRIGAPTCSLGSVIAAGVIAAPSRHLAEQAVADLAGELRAVLVRLEETNHGLVDGLRLLPQLMHAEPGERGGPIECLRDAGHLTEIFPAYSRDHAGD